MQFFIFLSCYPAFISNAIFGCQRSLNLTSTASRLMFAHSLLFLHHCLRLRHRNSPRMAYIHPAMSPSPLFRDVGSTKITSAPSEARSELHAPLPFPKGCGPAHIHSTVGIGEIREGTGGWKNTRGDPGLGGPSSASRKRTTMESGSFLSSFFPSHPH